MPFLVAWPVLAVIMFFIVPFAARFSSAPPNAAYDLAELASSRALRHLFMHLWFLYDLMILCVAASVLRLLAARIPAFLRTRAMDLFERWVHRGGIAVLILASGLILYRMESWTIDYYAGPFPPPRLLALYALFFGFGWMLFHRRQDAGGLQAPRVDIPRRRGPVLLRVPALPGCRWHPRVGQDVRGGRRGTSSAGGRLSRAFHVVHCL